MPIPKEQLFTSYLKVQGCRRELTPGGVCMVVTHIIVMSCRLDSVLVLKVSYVYGEMKPSP